MERITSHQVVGLMEAYAAVHTPQINEEQVWEEVETWVNSLVEEGYDLSEYSWEDMYENYLNEYAGGGVPGSGGAVTMYSRPRSNSSTVQSRFARPMNAGTPQTYGGGRSQSVTVRPPVASLPSSARQVTQYPQGVSTGVGGGNAGASRQAPAARPAAAARPSAPAPAPARPAAAAARPATAAPAGAKPSTATTGNPPLKPPALPPVPGRESLASQAAELRAMQAASRQRQGLTQSFDVFDVIKGHLIDEGYADTEEAALQIMANMSEEWRESIVEEVLDERNRGEQGKSDAQVRMRRDERDGDRSAGGFKPYVRAGGNQRSEHEGNRGKKKVKGRVGASMRGPNDNVSNYHASSEEN
jgi:hypothetical protein